MICQWYIRWDYTKGKKMKIFRGKYNYQTLAKSKSQDGSETKLYIDVQFPKNEEPDELELDGDLIFRYKGEDKKCFISCYQKNDGSTVAKLVFNKSSVTEHNMMDDKGKRYEPKLNDGDTDMFGASIDADIDPDDLPFY